MSRVTSISDVRYFKQCRELWNFASEIRQNLKPGRSPKYFTFGRGFHAGMEAYYDDLDPVSAFIDRMWEEALDDKIPTDDEVFLEMIDFGSELICEYELWDQSPGGGIPFPYEVISTEEAHTVHLFGDIHYGFRTDLIVVNRDTGELWLVDFKTASVMPTDNTLRYLDTDEQATAYLYASEQVCDCKFAGIIFIFACTKRFSEPRVLKNGTLSKNANQYTTVHKYMQALSGLDLNPEEYFDIIKILTEKEFFKRVVVRRTEAEKEYFWKNNLIPVVREMADNPLIYPSPSRINCSMCSYTGACAAANDPRLSLETELRNYTKGQPRYIITEEVL